MANAISSSYSTLVTPTIRADLPSTVEVSPDLRDALVVVGGSTFVAIMGMALASYLMLPFGAG